MVRRDDKNEVSDVIKTSSVLMQSPIKVLTYHITGGRGISVIKCNLSFLWRTTKKLRS